VLDTDGRGWITPEATEDVQTGEWTTTAAAVPNSLKTRARCYACRARRLGDGAGIRRRPASRVGGRAVRGQLAVVQRARGVPARAASPVLLAGGAVHGARARPVPPRRASLAGRGRRAAIGPLATSLVPRAGRRLPCYTSHLVHLVRCAQAKEEGGPRRGRLAHVRRRPGRSIAQRQRVLARHIVIARVHVAVSKRAVRPQNDTPRDRIIYNNIFD